MKFYANKLALCGVAAFGLTMLAACGDSNTTEVTEQTGMDVLAKGEKLPDCTKDNAGDMLYVTDSAAVYYCADGKWATLNGKDGEPGKEGTSTEGTPGKSCTAKTVDNGIEVSCDGKVIGTIKNGEPGVATDGNPGAGCKIDESEGNGIVKVTCGEGDDEKTVTLYKAMCGTESYDPEEKVCFEYVLYGKADGYNADGKVLYDSRDNQLYKTVEICDKDNANCQTWMAQNLNFNSNFKDTENKDVINSWCGGGKSGTETEGDCSVYGRLYLWSAAMDSAAVFSDDGKDCGYYTSSEDNKCEASGTVRGACPSGWHLPSYEEWNSLFTAVGGTNNAGTKLKSVSGWNSNGNGTDAYGFSALPAGRSDNVGYFQDAGEIAYFWSASQYENSSNDAYFMFLYYDYEEATLDHYYKFSGYSVRCIKTKPAAASN